MSTRSSAQRVASRHLAASDGVSKGPLQDLLGMFQALYFLHWTTHWQTKGDPYYGDHLLFERLYGALPEEIDTLAEKLVQLHGSEAVSPMQIHPLMSGWLSELSMPGDPDIVGRALGAEREFQRAILSTYEGLKASGELSLGLDDFLMSTANAHETHLYLLQQRMGGILHRSASAYLSPDQRRKDWEQLKVKLALLPVVSRPGAIEIWKSGDGLFYVVQLTGGLAGVAQSAYEAETFAKWMSNGRWIREPQWDLRRPIRASRGTTAPSAEAHFFDSPQRRETAEFATSRALTNVPVVSTQLKYDNGKPRAERRRLDKTPSTPDEIVRDTPGSADFSTLSRYVVQTEDTSARGVPQSHDDVPKHPDIK